jgi:hypothetical protein
MEQPFAWTDQDTGRCHRLTCPLLSVAGARAKFGGAEVGGRVQIMSHDNRLE